MGPVASEHRYNLLSRYPEIELNQACRELGLGIVVWSPLQMGLLSESYKKAAEEGQRSQKFNGNIAEDMRKKLQAFTKICEELGETEAVVATAWILNNPDITSVNIGSRTAGHLDILKAVDLRLPKEVIQELDTLFPGHGEEAPVVYQKM